MNKARLNRAKEMAIHDLHPKYIMNLLLTNKVVTEKESKTILSLTSAQRQVEKLFDILSTKGSKEFESFIKVLNMEDEYGVNYPWLAEKLQNLPLNFENEQRRNLDQDIEQRGDVNANVYKLLVDGGVPFKINCLLHREKKIKDIRKELMEAASKRHWVVLHGMSGTGKSVLAAEAIRNNELIDNYFPGGVFWVPLGPINDSNSLEMKMKRLHQTVLESRRDEIIKCISTIENLADLNLKLRKIVTNKMLIVLDDLWKEHDKDLNAVRLFDIGCTILVTTKFPGEFEAYSEYTTKILCRNDLLIEEGKQLLSKYVKCDKENLPHVVTEICRKCAGSPFTLSHIGRWMSPYGNDVNRWNYLRDLLIKGLGSTVRHRHSSEVDLDYIKEVVHLTLEPIEDYKTFFYDFVIFPEDVWVPIQVFTVLWDTNVFDVQDTMNLLTCNSLVQFKEDPIYGYSYGIHDLYLEILNEICSNDDKIERHQRLVNNYLKLCRKENGRYDFSLLPDDDYVHYYIAHHMSCINDNNIIDGITLDDIYFDLYFVEKKLRIDSRDLLWDYQNYKFNNQEDLNIFRSFTEKHAHIFANKDSDVIQLGLFESPDSIIYKKALKIASESKKSYYIWRNQEENQCHMQNLNVKRNFIKNTQHVTISSDGFLVAWAGTENKAVVYASSTGEDLLTLSGHTSGINYCLFNSSRDKLITASKDKTVRIFEINITYTSDMKPTKKRSSLPVINTEVPRTPDMSALTFAQHHSSVLCCSYSHDEDLVVSSDENGVAHVWQSSTTYLKCSVYHHTRSYSLQPVDVCCFSPDSLMFGTASYDSVKLWMTSTGDLFKEFLHDEMVVKGLCFKQNNLVISVANNEIYKHNIESEKIEKFKCSKNLVITCCCLSPDGNYLACGTSENTIIVFNINSRKLINNLKGHKSDIKSVMYTEDGKKLLAGSVDGYILYDMTYVKDTSLVSFEGNLSVRKSSDSLMIVSSNYFESLEVRKGYDARLVCKTEFDDSEITACSISNDCTEVVYGTKCGSVKVLTIQSNEVDDLPKHSGQVNYVTHSKSDKFFTCSDDKTIKIWNNRSPMVLKGHYDAVLMCVPFRKSDKLLSCSKDGILRVWDIITGKCLLKTEGHGNQDIRCCDISFDEKLLASASADGTVKLWKAENGEFYRSLECGDEVRCCRFSPSLQVLISGCDSGKVRLWSLGKNPTYEPLYQHSSCVYNIYFNKNGSQFLSIADDIKIWKLKESELQTLLLPSSSIGVARPSIWASDDFDLFVVILNSVLYVLELVNNPEKLTKIVARL